uniref:LIN1 n=2 Tax=Poeciliopsis prolifica TaxID=188132 RepID=A0A0S7EYH1_9TELE
MISDHAPLLLDIQLTSYKRSPPLWRLNPLLLADAEFCNYISNAIDEFLGFNKNDSTSYLLLWETLKAYLRGQIISYTSLSNKRHNSRLTELATTIAQLDQRYAVDPSPELFKERMGVQTEIDLISTKEAERLLLRSKGSYYEHGDKAGRLLAHQLRRQVNSRMIQSIQNNQRVTTNDPIEINDTFKSFYSSLYSSEFPTDINIMGEFLQGLSIPTIDASTAKTMDSPLGLGEVINSIKALQSHKAPGPDGFPVEFYKKFIGKLAPLLLAMFNESLECKTLPPTLTQATIVLLHKKDKDPTMCGSYRPLSLLNVDVKVLAKLIASRLEKVLPFVISEEQNGFVKGRQLFFNTRTLLNVIYSKHSPDEPEIVISLDAEKAFDRVEWEYLFEVLKKFGLGDTFVSWIRLLYSSPKASVNTNDVYSDYFSLGRGTRQGCPLSPLLFIMAIEPLSIALRASSSFRGIFRNGTEHKLSLYADDLLLYISNPTTSVPAILRILNNFSSFSGYKLNLEKSECFPINTTLGGLQLSDFPFKLSPNGIKYLGINVTRSISGLASANFSPLIAKTALDFQCWRNLPLSLLGRINVVKMNVLPKFLFLFQSIPLFMPKTFFDSLDRLINGFIWIGKSPRVRKALLQSCKLSGGLALPDFQLYYWAAHIHKINYWLNSSSSPWCKLELSSCIGSSLSGLIFSSLPVKPSLYTKNQVVLNTLKVWFQFRRRFKFTAASPLCPLTSNHLFPPSLSDPTFSVWWDRGLKQIKNLYASGVFDSFEDLSSKYSLPGTHLFRYLQIRNFASKCFPNFPSLPPELPWERISTFNPLQKGTISKIYSFILKLRVDSSVKIRNAWEKELGIQLTQDSWDVAIGRIRSSSSCARLSLIQFKVVHRIHFSKSRLSQIYPDMVDVCDKCKGSPCNLGHMFYLCPSLYGFWYQESNITLRRYTEDKQVQETEPKRLVRGSLFVKEVIDTTVCCIT